ncbi:MAG: DUF3126 family protein [Parvularculaceae bacterium]
MDPSEVSRVQKYLRDKFGCPRIQIRRRSNKDDSAEVFIDDEFIGVIFRDDDEGELSFAFQMAILDVDLPTVAEVSAD